MQIKKEEITVEERMKRLMAYAMENDERDLIEGLALVTLIFPEFSSKDYWKDNDVELQDAVDKQTIRLKETLEIN